MKTILYHVAYFNRKNKVRTCYVHAQSIAEAHEHTEARKDCRRVIGGAVAPLSIRAWYYSLVVVASIAAGVSVGLAIASVITLARDLFVYLTQG